MITLEPPAVRTEADRLALGSTMSVSPEPASLAERVAQIALAIDEGQLVPVTATWTGTALQPRTLLALLVYCYAVGVFSSQAIEEQMHEDRQFRLLCGNEYPDWHQLRRFRRLNRPVIQHCLERVLGWASGGRAPNFDCALPPRSPEPPTPPSPPRSGLPATIAQEASDRLNWAAQLDSMDLDV